MAKADLTNYGIENIEAWMYAMQQEVERTLGFVTHPTGAGAAATGPILQAKPAQVMAFEWMSVSRHLAADASEGFGASVDLVRGMGVQFDGDADLFNTISGSRGNAQFDTNMRYLVEDVDAGSPNLNVDQDTAGGVTTENVYTGVMTVPLVEPNYGDIPTAILEEHTHEDNDNGGTLGRNALSRTDISFAGTIGTSSWVTFALNPYSFFPMIHVTRDNIGTWSPWLNGHNVDAGDADSPRFGMGTDSVGGGTYDVDARSIDA